MLKARKSIFVLLFVIFVLVSFGIAGADQIDGLTNSGPTVAYVNPGAMGDTLLYNYYNVRNGMQTFFTVVNTNSTQGERVRIRFREAADIDNAICVDHTTGKGVTAASFEVLDFDICLTAGDEWSGFVTAAPGGGAMLCSNDTDTPIFDGVTSGPFPTGCVPFKTGTFGTGTISATITADDTMEGYFEIIGENQLNPDFSTCEQVDNLSCTGAGTSNQTASGKAVCCTGPATGTCADETGTGGTGTRVDVPNVLFGNAALIDGNTSATFGYDATAIADFANGNIESSPTTSSPDLTNGQDGIAGLNYILTKDELFTIYDLIHARSEIVLTEPTKLLTQLNVGCSAVGGPVNNNVFTDDSALFTVWNDSEKQLTTVCSFSPCPSGTVNSLPHEVNILQMNIPAAGVVSDILDSVVDQSVAITFDFGWINIDLDPNIRLAVPHSTCFSNGTISDCSAGWPILGQMYLDVDHGASTTAFPVQYSSDFVN